jgi:hypothetical protein
MADFLTWDTHLIILGDDIVILDAKANAYFCMAGAGTCLDVNGRRLSFKNPELRAIFAEEGFLAGAEPGASPRLDIPRVARDLGGAVADRLKATDVLVILAAWLSMAVSYHGRPFNHLMHIARRQRAPKASCDPEVKRLTAAFERVLPWLPFQGICLYRAFLLRRILHWRGHGTRWVFGAQTWPFHAHCWLQIGDTALDDTADRLAAYQPILVI